MTFRRIFSKKVEIEMNLVYILQHKFRVLNFISKIIIWVKKDIFVNILDILKPFSTMRRIIVPFFCLTDGAKIDNNNGYFKLCNKEWKN